MPIFPISSKSISSGMMRKDMDREIPQKYHIDSNINDICDELTNGQGYVRITNVFGSDTIDEVMNLINIGIAKSQQGVDNSDIEALQNNYSGVKWGLMAKGAVIHNMLVHPLILSICREILGMKCRLSSVSVNTVLPGMGGQIPHLDYPYHGYMWPSKNGNPVYPTSPLMSLTIIMLLTDFTLDNGATAVIPGSQRYPIFPHNKELFHKTCKQITGRSGDILIIAGGIQHCSMPNTSNASRSALLQQMVPVFVTPFEDIAGDENEFNQDVRSLLGMDFEHPMVKDGREIKEVEIKKVEIKEVEIKEVEIKEVEDKEGKSSDQISDYH